MLSTNHDRKVLKEQRLSLLLINAPSSSSSSSPSPPHSSPPLSPLPLKLELLVGKSLVFIHSSIIICTWACLCVGICMHVQMPPKARRGHPISWSWSYGYLCVTWYERWKPNLSYLQEQGVLLTSEPSLQCQLGFKPLLTKWKSASRLCIARWSIENGEGSVVILFFFPWRWA